MYHPTRYSKSGFSLVEIILGAAISVILVLVLTQFVGIISNIQKYLGGKLPTQGDIEQALQIMTVEVRSIGQASSGAFPIEGASSTSFTFYSDIDRDGLMERVRYIIGSSTLQKGVIHPTGNPPQYVSSSEVFTAPIQHLIASSSGFAYFDSGYTGTQQPLAYPVDVTAIRSVQMTLTADISTTTAPSFTTLTGLVMIRNLKTN